ncbi:hypothetical protein GGR58DRAFT_483113 [Xylaria digitata]|nr:hypothetical protein GGR58DRAFT_483113 [Xylaria digitata]
MKLKSLSSIAIAHIGVAWALPTPADSALYSPCPGDVFNTAYCCSRGFLGNFEACIFPLLPISDEAFQGQCNLFGKTPVCCVRPLIGTPVLFCVNPPGLNPFLTDTTTIALLPV